MTGKIGFEIYWVKIGLKKGDLQFGIATVVRSTNQIHVRQGHK